MDSQLNLKQSRLASHASEGERDFNLKFEKSNKSKKKEAGRKEQKLTD